MEFSFGFSMLKKKCKKGVSQIEQEERKEKKRKEKRGLLHLAERLDFIVATRLEDEQGSQMGARNQEGFNKEVMEE
jgi:hypothetical protein